MSAYLRLTTNFHSEDTSDQATNDQLDLYVFGIIERLASRFEADDSLSICQVYRVGLAKPTSNPVHSSLQHNCTVFGVELETT